MNSAELSALFDQHPTELAPALLGCELTVSTAEGAVTVRLTEVEAYGDQGEDPGAHSFNGRTARNAALFGPPRHAYVYLSYGIHRCLNLVANGEAAGGVLLRAADVVSGRDLAVQRRGRDDAAKLLSGPGRLGQGLGIELSADGAPLSITDSVPETAELLGEHDEQGASMQLSVARSEAVVLCSGPRVGVSGVGGSSLFPWRYWIEGADSVSPYRPGRNVVEQND